MAEKIIHYQVPRSVAGKTYGFRALCAEASVGGRKFTHLTANPSAATCSECRAIYEERLRNCQTPRATVEASESGEQ